MKEREKMRTLKPIGATPLYVPRLGLGTAPLSGLYAPVPAADALATIHYALEQGLNFFDTAPLYGAGQSERYLGQALAGTPRDSYVLATKVGRLVTAEGDVRFDFSRDGVRRSLDESLQRLQMDYVDILHIHDPDNHYPQALDEAFPALAELRRQGVIKAVGAGMNQWPMLADFARQADFDCFLLAGRYTLQEQTALPFLELCQAKGISLILGGVFNSGILATGPQPGAKYNYADAPPAILEKVRRIESICAQYQVPLNAAALQFALAHPAVTGAVIGARSTAELSSNLQARRLSIPADLWADLRAAGLIEPAAPLPPGD
jgi:D-threo-aldose 1-dehydrogenase